MPELPEVETMVRGIRPLVEGRRITAFEACPCSCRPMTLSPAIEEFARRVVGEKVTAVERLAKRGILRLGNGDRIVIEPRMTGLLLLDSPPDVEHLRYEWRFAGRREYNSLWFWDQRGLGTIRLYTTAEFEESLGRGRLGPDALTMTFDDWRSGCRDANRPIKVLLLDQRVAAGIGNLYASEILHRSAIHPEHRANRLSSRQLERMAAVVREVLEEAIRYEGSTLGDGTYRNALNKEGGYQNAHRVYAREAETCTTCGKGRIVRIVQAQRSTFFCPRCQRPPRVSTKAR